MPATLTTGAFPPILLVSMQKSVERRREALRSLKKLDLKYHWIKACDGSQLSAQDIHKIYRPDETRRFYGSMGKGEIGCYLSHLECYKFMVEQDIPQAVIMEDDMRPNTNLLRVLKLRHQFPKDWGLVHLSPNRIGSSQVFLYENVFHKRKLFGSCYISRYFYDTHHTHLYLITQQFARKLLTYLWPIRLPIDCALFDTMYSANYPYAVYQIKQGKYTSPNTGDINDKSIIDVTDPIRAKRSSSGPHASGQTPHQRLIKYILSRAYLIFIKKPIRFFAYLSIRIVCYLPWSDKNKPDVVSVSKFKKNILVRFFCLLLSVNWRALFLRLWRPAQSHNA